MDNLVYNFNVNAVISDCCGSIWSWFRENGPDCNAVIGISGGKDSAVVAALCVRALGKNRVIGVKLPYGEQDDMDSADEVIKSLDIKSYEINLKEIVDTTFVTMSKLIEVTEQTKINLPARLRMSVLYGVSQSINGRVMNTTNLSEEYVGYVTQYGDGAGDYAPIARLTSSEVITIGKELGMSEDILSKEPTDGLCGKTDEESLGFAYSKLDDYIRLGPDKTEISSEKEKIEQLYSKNRFKLKPMVAFEPNIRTLYNI
jgi:NAD+ synthase